MIKDKWKWSLKNKALRGTAINLTIFALPRLSVDLDFDFSENIPLTLLSEKRAMIITILSRYMNAEGYTRNPKSKTTHSLDSFVYSYSTSGGSNDNIKIEINYSLRSHILPICERAIVIPLDEAGFLLRTLSPFEIYAGKTVAFMSRGAARDLYDIYGMISANPFTDDDLVLFRKCVAYYSAISGNSPITNNDKKIFPVITQHMIKTDLNQMLRMSEYFDGETANQRVSETLNEWLIFSDSELRFGKEFSEGRYKPDLLFEDVKILGRIETHPMAIWRTGKIREASGSEK